MLLGHLIQYPYKHLEVCIGESASLHVYDMQSIFSQLPKKRQEKVKRRSGIAGNRGARL